MSYSWNRRLPIILTRTLVSSYSRLNGGPLHRNRPSIGKYSIRGQLPEKSTFFGGQMSGYHEYMLSRTAPSFTSTRYYSSIINGRYGRGMSTTPPPLPPPKPSRSFLVWLKCIIGTFFISLLPSWKQKLQEIEDEVELGLDVAETVVDVVEAVAMVAEKVSSEVGDDLENGKLKDALDYVEDVSKEIVETMETAKDAIQNVDDIREEVETLLNPNPDAN